MHDEDDDKVSSYRLMTLCPANYFVQEKPNTFLRSVPDSDTSLNTHALLARGLLGLRLMRRFRWTKPRTPRPHSIHLIAY